MVALKKTQMRAAPANHSIAKMGIGGVGDRHHGAKMEVVDFGAEQNAG